MTDAIPWLLAALGWAILAGLAYRRWGWPGAVGAALLPLGLVVLAAMALRPRREEPAPTRPRPTTLPPEWERQQRARADDIREEAMARRDALPQSDDSEEAIVQRIRDREQARQRLGTGGGRPEVVRRAGETGAVRRPYIVHEVVQDGPDDA